MGNEQSSQRSPAPPQQAQLSQEQVRQLLNEQRQMYERTYQEIVDRTSRQSVQNVPSVPRPPPRATAPQVPPAPMPQTTAPLLRNATPGTPAANAGLQNDVLNVFRPSTHIGVGVGVEVTRSSGHNLIPNVQPCNNPRPSSSSTTVHVFNFNDHAVQNPPRGFVMVENSPVQPVQVERPRQLPPVQSRRDRSASRSGNNNRARSGDGELNCPTCHNMYGLQIYQCNTGHSSCKSCKEERKPCGLCGNTINNMRNITLESYISERTIPCLNKNDGCKLVIKMADMEFHLKECPFNELQCPLGCNWKGRLKQLSSHFDNRHPSQHTVVVGAEIRLQDIFNNSQNAYLVVIGGYNFLFHVKVSRAECKVYMTAQLIGTKMSASKWSYEIHVYNKDECRRKYVWVDECTSHNEPVADIFEKGYCSVLSSDYASSFLNNGALCYKFFINPKEPIEYLPRSDCGRNQRRNGRTCRNTSGIDN